MNKKIGFFFFGLLVLFSLGCGGITDMITSQVGQLATEDPVEAAKRGQAITDYTLSQGFAERMAMGMLGFEMVFISDQPLSEGDQKNAAQTIIILAKLPSNVAADDKAKTQLREALSQQTGSQTGQTETQVVDTRQITINGQPTELIIEEGKTDKGETYRLMIASFTAKDEKSPAMLLVAGPTTSWNESAVNEFLDSMQ